MSDHRTRRLGLLAVCAAILCFSVSSSIVKKADTPGPVIALWRMLASVLVWQGVLWATGRRTTVAQMRAVLVPGVLFGLNLAVFFTAVTRTSIAHAEFLGAMTPIILIPAGAVLFGEHVKWRAMGWGVLAVAGIALVLFTGSGQGSASIVGDLLVFVAMFMWASYLLTTKRSRKDMDVVQFMAAVVPIAALTLLPILFLDPDSRDVSAQGWIAVAVLTLLTGTMAHGFIVFAQRTVPIGTIGMMQVAQPALAVVWAALLLGETIKPIQMVGMAMVLCGLGVFTWSNQLAAPPIDVAEPMEELEG